MNYITPSLYLYFPLTKYEGVEITKANSNLQTILVAYNGAKNLFDLYSFFNVK